MNILFKGERWGIDIFSGLKTSVLNVPIEAPKNGLLSWLLDQEPGDGPLPAGSFTVCRDRRQPSKNLFGLKTVPGRIVIKDDDDDSGLILFFSHAVENEASVVAELTDCTLLDIAYREGCRDSEGYLDVAAVFDEGDTLAILFRDSRSHRPTIEGFVYKDGQLSSVAIGLIGGR